MHYKKKTTIKNIVMVANLNSAIDELKLITK